MPKWESDAEAAWRGFLERLEGVRVLDPACGSGNFLYVTLRKLKDLEQQAIRRGSERLGITGFQPRVGPHNLLGIELNPYAKELAGVSIWVGHIQWMIENGYGFPRDPVLQPLDNIELRDAILARDAEGNPIPATWPEAEFIVGNPPFLGSRRLRGSLPEGYVDELFRAWEPDVTQEQDFVCYWHEMARRQIQTGEARRAGLLATNSIRGGSNRRTLDRIRGTGRLFLAWSDEPWIVDGAAVRVSIVGQDDGSETVVTLDGQTVGEIFSDLTGGGAAIDVTKAKRLPENARLAYQGVSKGGPFELDGETARRVLRLPTNVSGEANSAVVRPWIVGADITGRPSGRFLIDFADRDEEASSYFEVPFEYVREHVLPVRARNARASRRDRWWRLAEVAVDMRHVIEPLARFIVTPRVSKHRLFVWAAHPVLPDTRLAVIAREDDYALGVLHSRAHELWSLRTGGWHGVGNDPQYTPSVSFETFPFPWPLNTPDDALTAEQREHRDAIGAAAAALDADRRHWLNPPEWVREEPDVLPSLPPRLVPVDEDAERQLKQRTLTNLYNDRPAWLQHRHAALDRAVFAAYGWPEPPEALDEETILARLLALNLERAAGQ